MDDDRKHFPIQHIRKCNNNKLFQKEIAVMVHWSVNVELRYHKQYELSNLQQILRQKTLSPNPLTICILESIKRLYYADILHWVFIYGLLAFNVFVWFTSFGAHAFGFFHQIGSANKKLPFSQKQQKKISQYTDTHMLLIAQSRHEFILIAVVVCRVSVWCSLVVFYDV